MSPVQFHVDSVFLGFHVHGADEDAAAEEKPVSLLSAGKAEPYPAGNRHYSDPDRYFLIRTGYFLHLTAFILHHFFKSGVILLSPVAIVDVL